MALCIHFVRYGVGYVAKGHRFVCLLESGGGRDLSRVIWKMTLLCVIWCIWRERNARIFEDKECSMDGVRKNMIAMLHVWMMAHYHNEIPTIEEFLHMCHLYIS
jgi:hypothetical protein